jgi:hypothetical protein
LRVSRVFQRLIVSALVVVGAVARPAAQVFDPALKFHVLRTEHFAIYFHQGGERAAQRLTAIAEETWRTLQRRLDVAPPQLTHVVLADQSESANGYATPIPYDTVVIYPVWPAGSDWDFDDWLRLAFTHEFTHIVHLDRSEGWARIARDIFGRAFYAFPNVFLPLWQIEGIATYEESVVTGHGRLHAGDYQAIVGEAARARALEPLDRVNGGLTDWPAGATHYAYGVGFTDYLARRFGAEKMAQLATATARRFPYTSTRAFEYVYGESLGDLWREYEASLVDAVTEPHTIDTNVTRVTKQGFWIAAPRFDRFVCAGCAPQILYSARNPDGFPGLYRVALDGTAPRLVTERYLGASTGIAQHAIYFDQVERRRNVGFYSDLYVMSRIDGEVRRLTTEARLLDPDVSPDGTTIVCTQVRGGERDLVLIHLGGARSAQGDHTVVPLVAEPDVFFDAPRWSPDGRTVAAERHRLGSLPEIALVDVATRSVRILAADAHTRFTMPTWRPDGAAIVAAAAPEQETFNLVELAIDGSAMRTITHTTGGAIWPDVSPDGTTIAFAGYTTAGYDVFTMPYPAGPDDQPGPTRVPRPAPAPVLSEPAAGADRGSSAAAGSRAYNPFTTLAPTSWTPVIDNDGETVRLGGSTGGVDVLGYHSYSASASWLATSTTRAPLPDRRRPDWQLYYEYARWRPKFYVAASTSTSFSVGPATAAGTASDSTLRETSLETGVFYPVLHARTLHGASASIARAHSDFTFADGSLARNRTALRASWQTITARTYGYSISREDGFAVGGTAETVRRAFGSDADATTFTGDLRLYAPGAMPHHVVGLRLSGGVSKGDATVGRTFLLGGADPATSVVDLSSRASSLLRGFPDATFAGTRVVLANAEYRFPVYRLERGFGTWPIFFHTFHGSAFADAGETWSADFRLRNLKTSFGLEASVDIVAAYFAQLTITAGAALGHDRSGAVRDASTLYVRVGKAF